MTTESTRINSDLKAAGTQSTRSEPLIFNTPPRWTSWRRPLALLLGIVGLLLCYQISYVQITDYYSRAPFTLFSIPFNLILLWPLIPTYIGWSGFVGTWGFVNRIVIDGSRTTLHLLGPFGKEQHSMELQSLEAIKKGRIIGMVNGKREEIFIKAKYLTPALKDALDKAIGKK
jgi:hypothetical protein